LIIAWANIDPIFKTAGKAYCLYVCKVDFKLTSLDFYTILQNWNDHIIIRHVVPQVIFDMKHNEQNNTHIDMLRKKI